MASTRYNGKQRLHMVADLSKAHYQYSQAKSLKIKVLHQLIAAAANAGDIVLVNQLGKSIRHVFELPYLAARRLSKHIEDEGGTAPAVTTHAQQQTELPPLPNYDMGCC